MLITGGALGVDYWALDEALKIDTKAERIRVFLPSTLSFYKKHYNKRALEGIISVAEARALIAQLKKLKKLNKKALTEKAEVKTLNQNAYCARNSREVNSADQLIAFQVNQSQGVQDTIDKAKEKQIPVQVHQFTI
jgi:cell division protein FtsB